MTCEARTSLVVIYEVYTKLTWHFPKKQRSFVLLLHRVPSAASGVCTLNFTWDIDVHLRLHSSSFGIL
jgi:hypothetical protein